MSTVVEALKEAIIEGEDDLAVEETQKALEEGVNPVEIIKGAIVPGIERTGELWKDNVYFMPDVVLSNKQNHSIKERAENENASPFNQIRFVYNFVGPVPGLPDRR